MRGVFPSFEGFSAALLFKLASDPSLTSRVVTKQGPKKWAIEQGPFRVSSHKKRSTKDWTLLVQEVNNRVPLAQDIVSAYSFIPNWRVDDLMASFAVPGGSVGPHTDNYDVFLIQAWGTRRWEVSARTDFSLIPGLDLKVIDRFKPQRCWIARPGDVLYLPPGVAHYGVAQDECVTLSVGFRAPSVVNLIDAAFSAIPGEGPLLRDAGRRPCANRGEVTAMDFERMGEHLGALFFRDDVRMAIVDALTVAKRQMSEVSPVVLWTPPLLKKALAPDSVVTRDPSHRIAYCVLGPALYFAIDGHGAQILSKPAQTLVRLVCGPEPMVGPELLKFLSDRAAASVLCELFSLAVLTSG